MVVRTINNQAPDFNGNINIMPGVIYANDNTKRIKVWTGTAETAGTDGTWSINYTIAAFSAVVHVSTTVMAGSFSQANAPIATNLGVPTTTSVSGKAFKASSAGLLAAMQQTPAEPGTKIMVMIFGY